MSDQYLWDRTGPVDPEIERLESLLAPLRHRAPRPRRKPYAALAAAAAVAIAAAGLSHFAAAPPVTEWRVASVEGRALIGGSSARQDMPLRAGEVLRTAPGAHLALQDDALGRIELGPDSEMRAAAQRRVALDRGRLHAVIWAPPRRFVLDTPSARAVDLGCEYTMEVDPAGDGLLTVSMGWVAFEYHGRESFIPAGARCITRRGAGPGIPVYEDAPPALQQALARFETGDTGALAAVLSAARPRDGLTLWHLLTRASPRDRGAVFDCLAQLVPLPAAASRARVLRGDPEAIDLCWNALNLESTGWWRGWERSWPR
ncbi:MAG TPA: hypothetical protein VKX45_06405 [Bryobacteraceae bacterium]|nr:hypothetical protein [Bryobacteraceae bacterium]